MKQALYIFRREGEAAYRKRSEVPRVRRSTSSCFVTALAALAATTRPAVRVPQRCSPLRVRQLWWHPLRQPRLVPRVLVLVVGHPRPRYPCCLRSSAIWVPLWLLFPLRGGPTLPALGRRRLEGLEGFRHVFHASGLLDELDHVLEEVDNSRGSTVLGRRPVLLSIPARIRRVWICARAKMLHCSFTILGPHPRASGGHVKGEGAPPVSVVLAVVDPATVQRGDWYHNTFRFPLCRRQRDRSHTVRESHRATGELRGATYPRRRR